MMLYNGHPLVLKCGSPHDESYQATLQSLSIAAKTSKLQHTSHTSLCCMELTCPHRGSHGVKARKLLCSLLLNISDNADWLVIYLRIASTTLGQSFLQVYNMELAD